MTFEIASSTDELGTVEVKRAAIPKLSIAIPAFNRATKLQECLESILSEIEMCGTDEVEVWVTDDASTDVKAAQTAQVFANSHPMFLFRQNPKNLGLDANLLEACRPCNGEFVLLMGNDDLLKPGALEHLLTDIDSGSADVVAYGKERIDSAGAPIKLVSGAIPAGAVAGEKRRYRGILGFAKETGVLSGYGFISTILFRRQPFVEVDSERYAGLTMYPQVACLLEAFADASVVFRNVSVVKHRTTTRAEKLAEAFGRPEESFMAGGDQRDAKWFGPSLAASLMRVCDRCSLRPADFIPIPERLFRQPDLIAWISHNVWLAEQSDVHFSAEVDLDAARFFAELGIKPVASG